MRKGYYFEGVAGNWKVESSTGRFPSALSRMTFCLSEEPLRPASIDNGRIDAVNLLVIAQVGLGLDLRAVFHRAGW